MLARQPPGAVTAGSDRKGVNIYLGRLCGAVGKQLSTNRKIPGPDSSLFLIIWTWR